MHRKKKILVIDDDRLATSSMQALLEKERYRVEVINDGDQALQTLSWKKFDLIISDLVMKQMHGLGILAKVKEISAETPVIIITGYVSVKSAIEALRLGAFDYLIKPCENEELLLRIKRAFEKRDMERQLVEAQKKGMFTATVITANHEINQPLTAIFGAAGLIEMELKEHSIKNEMIEKQLSNVMKSTHRISDILHRLKKISRPILKNYTPDVQMIQLDDKLPAEKVETKSIPQPVTGKDFSILIVDDEQDLRQMMTDMLRRLNYHTFDAGDGQEALKIYRNRGSEVDLVITDMKMPRMGGKELYHKLKEVNSDVKILLSSGYDVEQEIKELLERGASGFLRKPFNIQQLTTAVDQALSA